MAGRALFSGCLSDLLPGEAGEVSAPALSEAEGSYGEGGVMSNESRAHDPSVAARRRHLPSFAGEENRNVGVYGSAPGAVAAEASQAGRRPARRGECRAIAQGNLRAGRRDRIVSASTDSSRWAVDPAAPSRARATAAIRTGATARLCVRPQQPRRMLSCGRSNPLISLDATASDRTDRKKRPSFCFGGTQAALPARGGKACPARRPREESPFRLAAAAAAPGRSPTGRIAR